jgi:hypothetical protein
MNPPRCDDLDYIHFLIAAQRAFTCTEAARCQPGKPDAPAHDAFTRLLRRSPPDMEALWKEAGAVVKLEGGVLVLDDTTRHDSGQALRPEDGAGHLPLEREAWPRRQGHKPHHAPLDRRRGPHPMRLPVYDRPMGGSTKNEHFRGMLRRAEARGFRPSTVLFDSWYSSLENLKLLRSLGWRWLTRLKGNRLVDPDRRGNRPVEEVEVPPEGCVVHLKGYGMVKVFRAFSKDGDAEYWATDDLEMLEEEREALPSQGWGIEAYHRGLKQCCGIERAQGRGARAQLNHLAYSIRAFIRLEAHRLRRGISWYEAKASIIREAIRAYLAKPIFTLAPTA